MSTKDDAVKKTGKDASETGGADGDEGKAGDAGAAAAREGDPSPYQLRRDAVRHGIVRVRGSVATARRRLDLHALADAVAELLDLLEQEIGG
jgi:hypothetical protein